MNTCNFYLFQTLWHVTLLLVLLIFATTITVGNASAQDKFTFQKSSSFIDEDNIMHVYGEIKNIFYKAMTNVVVKASFYDDKGNLLKEFQRATELRTINPSEVSPFEILYIDSTTVNKIKSFKLSATGIETKTKDRELQIYTNNSRLDILGFYYINGRIVNQGMETATNSMVIATLYDKDGRVVAVGIAQTEPTNITSHSGAAFGVAITEKMQTYKVKSYSLIADSDQYVVIPEFYHSTELLFVFFIGIIAATKLKSIMRPTCKY